MIIWILMADFESMVPALSFIWHIYEANECPSVEAKICLMPLLLLDYKTTPVAMFHIEKSLLWIDYFAIDKVALPVCFCIP